MVEAQYELLKLTPPFNRWKLPPGDEVEFFICKLKDREADYVSWTDGRMRIRLSIEHVKTLDRLAMTLGHEMIHMHMDRAKIPAGRNFHGWRFQRFARAVCLAHDWDVTRF
jgi:hypothetical protein